MKQYTFRPNWAASVSVAVLLPLFVTLGMWQLHRAEERQLLLDARNQMSSEPPLELDDDLLLEGHRFRRVEARGTYDPERQILLDNQIFNHQPGYHVLTPLKLRGGGVSVLVNRGWIPLGADRTQRPELPITATQARITGLLDRFPRVGFKLAGADVPAPGWPAVVQVLDADRLTERLGYRVLPYQVLLDADEADGYVRDWRPMGLDPAKNQGYALQWFSFAAVLLVLYLWYGFKADPTV